MPRTAQVVDVPALGEIDRQAGQLSHQLAQALRRAIHKGDLKAGDLLPSTRRLSAALNLARGTVLAAFAQLTAEGFLEPQPGSGTSSRRECNAILHNDVVGCTLASRNHIYHECRLSN